MAKHRQHSPSQSSHLPADLASQGMQAPDLSGGFGAHDASMGQSPYGNGFIKDRVAQREGGDTFGAATKGGGSKLPFLSDMEASFGEDFGGISWFAGQGAAMDALGANAATDGESVATAAASPSKRLIAHELTHVVQRRKHGGAAGVQPCSKVSRPSDSSEREADAVASRAARGERVDVRQSAGPGIYRDQNPSAGNMTDAQWKEYERQAKAAEREGGADPDGSHSKYASKTAGRGLREKADAKGAETRKMVAGVQNGETEGVGKGIVKTLTVGNSTDVSQGSKILSRVNADTAQAEKAKLGGQLLKTDLAQNYSTQVALESYVFAAKGQASGLGTFQAAYGTLMVDAERLNAMFQGLSGLDGMRLPADATGEQMADSVVERSTESAHGGEVAPGKAATEMYEDASNVARSPLNSEVGGIKEAQRELDEAVAGMPVVISDVNASHVGVGAALAQLAAPPPKFEEPEMAQKAQAERAALAAEAAKIKSAISGQVSRLTAVVGQVAGPMAVKGVNALADAGISAAVDAQYQPRSSSLSTLAGSITDAGYRRQMLALAAAAAAAEAKLHASMVRLVTQIDKVNRKKKAVRDLTEALARHVEEQNPDGSKDDLAMAMRFHSEASAFVAQCDVVQQTGKNEQKLGNEASKKRTEVSGGDRASIFEGQTESVAGESWIEAMHLPRASKAAGEARYTPVRHSVKFVVDHRKDDTAIGPNGANRTVAQMLKSVEREKAKFTAFKSKIGKITGLSV